MIFSSGNEHYYKPELTKIGNLKNLTAEWQCSAIGDTHSHTRGRGHCEHGNGNGYGHYR